MVEEGESEGVGGMIQGESAEEGGGVAEKGRAEEEEKK